MKKKAKTPITLKDDKIVKKVKHYWLSLIVIWVLLIGHLLFTYKNIVGHNFATALMIIQLWILLSFFLNVVSKNFDQFDTVELWIYEIIVPIFYAAQMAIWIVNSLKISYLIASFP